MARALANIDGDVAGMQRNQADYWNSEVGRAQEGLDRTSIRSPIDGVVATPQLENMVGRKLKVGESFLDIVDNSQALVDVSVTENDVALLRSGETASLKLDGFPERTFHGQVAVVSPQGGLQNDERVFFARVSVANPNARLRPGTLVRGKITTGWGPTRVACKTRWMSTLSATASSPVCWPNAALRSRRANFWRRSTTAKFLLTSKLPAPVPAALKTISRTGKPRPKCSTRTMLARKKCGKHRLSPKSNWNTQGTKPNLTSGT